MARMTFDSPLAAYQYATAQLGFVADDAQRRAVDALQACHQALHLGRSPISGRSHDMLTDSGSRSR